VGILKTEKKLREAKFFLGWMGNAAKSMDMEREDFEFYLSAFLSAGRSVTFVLQVGDKARYDAWFPGWKSALPDSDQELLQFMNDQRVSELHQLGAAVEGVIEEVPMSVIERDRDHTHPAYGPHLFGIHQGDPPGIPEPTMGRRAHYFNAGGVREKAIETCKRYAGLLEKLVQDFRRN
jgi:hypothetical protein